MPQRGHRTGCILRTYRNAFRRFEVFTLLFPDYHSSSWEMICSMCASPSRCFINLARPTPGSYWVPFRLCLAA